MRSRTTRALVLATALAGCNGKATGHGVAAGSTGGASTGSGGTSNGGTSSGGTSSGGAVVDAGTDGAVSQLSCTVLKTAWRSFVSSHAACAADVDCTTYLAKDPLTNACDAPPGLNAALNRGFAENAEPYGERYFELGCGGHDLGDGMWSSEADSWSDFGFDGTVFMNPRCVSGSRTADNFFGCNWQAPYDAGHTISQDASD